MKNIKYILSVIFAALILSACSKEEGINTSSDDELTFSATVQDIAGIGKQSIGQDFFAVGQSIDVSILSSKSGATTQSFVYTYGSDGIFRGNPGYRFPLDDTYISHLTAVWPSGAIRTQGMITDQRTAENYQLADWISATAATTADGIMPTSAPVPLTFTRENTMLDFELVGQNSEGVDIQSLVIEVHTGDQAQAYWAYCENPNGHAQLILEAGSKLLSPDNYLIGRLKANPDTDYTIIFPQTDIVLDAGKRYLVTLTPQGYHMYLYAMIGGWDQGEDGIGIPFQQPTPDVNGEFAIETPLQLITMSYLVRHYNDAQTFSWGTRTYNIDNGFAITAADAAEYIPIPKSLFSGQVTYNGNPIDTLRYGSDVVLPLFDYTK